MKKLTITILVVRILMACFQIYRFIIFLQNERSENYEDYETFVAIIIASTILDTIVFIFVTLSALVCVSNFGKGLKEILIKQALANETNTQLTEI
jgi:amino acid permease